MLMLPPHAHIAVHDFVSAGLFAMSTVGHPGAHGAGITGTHGMGVSTPMAAAVADATVGFDIELHIPKLIILTNGTLSIIVAMGLFCPFVIAVGSTTSDDGAFPKEHLSIAPITTGSPI